MLQQYESSTSHNVNQVHTSHNTLGIACTLYLTSPKSTSWVIDFGAIDRVCYSLDAFQTFHQIKPVQMKLPDGTQTTTIYLELLFSQTNFT